MNKKHHLELSDTEQSSLTSLISNGQLPARLFRRATALLELARGKSLVEVATTLSVTYQTVSAWRDAYRERGLDALHDKARSGRPVRIDGKQRAFVTALACSTPPEGRAQWSLRLLADRAVELGYCSKVSHNAIREILKKTLKPHLKKTWCMGTINASFLAQMERLLWLYSLPLDARFPVVCFDERPCFLLGHTVEALAMKASSLRRENYEYEKLGSCASLAAIEPLTGKRLAQVFDHRRKHEYALFLKELAAQYPEAEKIRLVQDNLNTHDTSSLYETFAADEAFRLSQRFEFSEITREVVRAIECSCYGYTPARTNSRDASISCRLDLSQYAHQLPVFVIGVRPHLA